MGQCRQQKQGHDVRDLDHWVYGWTSGILIWVTNGVAGNGCLMGLRTFATMVAVFDIFLGIVPCAAARGHRDSNEQSAHNHTEQERAESRKALCLTCNGSDDEIYRNWRQYGQQRRNNHFLDRSLGNKVNCTGIIWLGLEGHDAGVVRELVTHVLHHFTGRTIRDVMTAWAAERGHALPADWMERFLERRNAALAAELLAVDGIHETVAALHAGHQGRIACASGADRFKVEMQLRQVGLLRWFEGRVFSGHEMPRSKPAPDVYLAAAAHLGVDPARCLVVEDTATGAQAGLAAGATVWGYCPDGHGRAFAGLPVQRVFHHMRELLDSGLSDHADR